jgi:hypothetical protein
MMTPDEQLAERCQPQTSCEEYGHDFVTDEDDPTLHFCVDCGESYQDEVK